ncbi:MULTISPECIES: PE family protein [unclassified Mycobacterium]|uniref:PE family protein n=1 Tax=unclassified Mycobacterium TaxID=2642494 RepID=UPI000F98FB24|nr:MULTISPECIES: PE domain-containing protein [unclassified Mycobacterium]MDP7705216.1 PE domain-containing protein [Mycobacterium sp. TY815]MDP7723557.1 PE domain-containing protein [Mycobacterium sp. TY814]RUP02469.1 MAG: PE family protein [Mycobacterium sp.]
MTDYNHLSIRPDEVTEVTRQLDELANRMQHVLDTERPNLTTIASGQDEVSQRVAHTLNEVHGSFTKSSEQGANEIREVSATMRSHAGRISETDLAD